MLIDKRLRLGFKHDLLARDLAQSAIIDTGFFYFKISGVKRWGWWEGGGGGGGGACVNGWRLS